jgi:transcriptional regulator with XRE-family HTH domain
METIAVPTEFGSELRRWRDSRRVSQLELAIRAGTTQRHLSFIERGRSMPGRAIVVRLAEALGLSLRERNSLLLRAGYAPLFPESGLDEPLLRPVRDALEGISTATRHIRRWSCALTARWSLPTARSTCSPRTPTPRCSRCRSTCCG